MRLAVTLETHLRTAIWPLDWLVDMKGSLPADVVSARQFPRVYAWIERFRAAVKAGKAAAAKPVTLKGPQAVQHILAADFAEPSGGVEADEPLGLTAGSEVDVYPTDTGFSHHERGRLLTLTRSEVTVGVQSRQGGQEVRIHAPRTGFRVARAAAAAGSGAKL